MVTYLEAFRHDEFSMDNVIGHRIVYKHVNDVFVLRDVVDESIIQFIQAIRKKKTQSKILFEDCFIYFGNSNRDLGVCRDTNVEEFKRRALSSRTLFTPLSVLTQHGSTLQSPIVTSSLADVLHHDVPRVNADKIVTIGMIIDNIKIACQDEEKIDEKKINEVQRIALAYNYNILPFLLESGRK